MTVEPGERVPDAAALLCDGEIAVERRLSEVAADSGVLLVTYGFSFSAIARNWWRQYDDRGWNDFDVPVVGVSRDGPSAQNAFLRSLDSPFRTFADVDGRVVDALDARETREHMADVEVASRGAFHLDTDRRVTDAWVVGDWTSPMPADEIEAAVGP